jgi:peroxiredoxin
MRDRLADGPVVLVFYLGYSCSACVHELCELNADLDRFHYFGAEVVAVSGDSPELTRQRFDQFGAFDFPVLSDPSHAVAKRFGTFQAENQEQPEQLLHATFIIDRAGTVRWAWCGESPFRNNMALLFELAQWNDGDCISQTTGTERAKP